MYLDRSNHASFRLTASQWIVFTSREGGSAKILYCNNMSRGEVLARYATSKAFRRRMVKRRLSRASTAEDREAMKRASSCDIDMLSWYYLDESEKQQGPFSTSAMRSWHNDGFLSRDLLVRYSKIDFLDNIPTSERPRDAYKPLCIFFPNPNEAFQEHSFVRKEALQLASLTTRNDTGAVANAFEEKVWYYTDITGKEHGTFQMNALLAYMESGRLGGTTLVRKKGENRWERKPILEAAESLKAIADLPSTVPPPRIHAIDGTDMFKTNSESRTESLPSGLATLSRRSSGVALPVSKMTGQALSNLQTRARRVSTAAVLEKKSSWLSMMRDSGAAESQERRRVRSAHFEDMIWVNKFVQSEKDF